MKVVQIDDIDQEVKELLGSRAEGETSEFDGDVVQEEHPDDTELLVLQTDDDDFIHDETDVTEVSVEISYADTEMLNEEPSVDSPQLQNWGKYTKQMLQTPKSAALNVKNA
ncbi:uncharacterized protein LOC108911911 isoform X2 [Anoplophora glabripennis]|uniref:uncharacterized protein LOC108911911 isoform X2 n=1 Tax=Anoplophora glabripennis TaxID=217634 RepID=UPI000875747D|nr:uncharacterized protein LOC108911911 isoform X2 [Anoplophora glabripennis]